MKEKQRRTVRPFDPYLHPKEVLLWQSKLNVTIIDRLISVLKFVLFFGIIIAAGITGYNLMRSPDILQIMCGLVILVGVAGVCRLPSGMMHGLIYGAEELYAVTNQRLFHKSTEEIKFLHLEHVPSINVLPNNILSFGAVFPQWTGLGDAEQVKLIIEQAQKERGKA